MKELMLLFCMVLIGGVLCVGIVSIVLLGIFFMGVTGYKLGRKNQNLTAEEKLWEMENQLDIPYKDRYYNVIKFKNKYK